jgi:CRISPR-associated endoribonuclease Cas6
MTFIIKNMEVRIMRLSCEYKTDKLPVANKMMFVSLIKEALKRVNIEYFEKLYRFEGNSNKQIKSFSFAVLLKGFEMEGQIFNIRDRIILNITTPDYEFGINVYNGLLNIQTFQYKDYTLKKLRINLVKEKFISEQQIVFKTMSPVCMRNKDNEFISSKDPLYVEVLNYIVDKNLAVHRGYGLKQPLQFEELFMKKVVVKEEITGFKESTNKNTFYVNAYAGTFKLTGDVEDLNFIYQSGIGFRRSQGFGMVDIV